MITLTKYPDMAKAEIKVTGRDAVIADAAIAADILDILSRGNITMPILFSSPGRRVMQRALSMYLTEMVGNAGEGKEKDYMGDNS